MRGAKLIFSLALIGLVFTANTLPAFGFLKEDWENFWQNTCQLPKKGVITWAICNLRERVKILEEKVTQMEEEIEEVLARIENLEGGFEDLNAKVEELEGKVEDLNSSVESLESWKETMEEWKGETEDWKINVDWRLNDLQDQIMWIKDRMFDIFVALEPERLLEKIKMADGAGSGLDADMVDGKHADEISLWGEAEGYIYPKNASSSVEITDEGNFYVLGNVGIGTMNPTQKLEVTGYVKAQGFCIGNDCRDNWSDLARAVLSQCKICILRNCGGGDCGQGNLPEFESPLETYENWKNYIKCYSIDEWSDWIVDDTDNRPGGVATKIKLDCTPPYGD
ncbi:hypothetical protein J7K91_01910 [bacterium]|nr:hypothetical protein [bacterium]